MRLRGGEPATLVRLMVAACLTVGCAPHVRLAAPDRGAPGTTRLAAFAKLRPALMPTSNANGAVDRAVEARAQGTLELADRRRVAHADDLIPVVLPGSDTANAAERSDAYESATWVLAGVALTAFAASIAMVSARDPAFAPDEAWIPMVIGTAVGAAASGTGQVADHSSAVAFASYEGDLARRLNLCDDEGVFFPCEAPFRAQSVATPEATPRPSRCEPECRQGFDCVEGACLSSCNPPCAEQAHCTGHGAEATCATQSATPTPPPPEPPSH